MTPDDPDDPKNSRVQSIRVIGVFDLTFAILNSPF